VLKYNRQLMQAILHDKIQIAKAVNVQIVLLEEAPTGYQDFDKGAAKVRHRPERNAEEVRSSGNGANQQTRRSPACLQSYR
jgi:hypothetical protein